MVDETVLLNENDIFDVSIKDQYLTFDIDNEAYGIAIAIIKEIIKVCDITKVPLTPSYVKGIINLRGDIITIVDIRTRFQKEEKPYDDLTCIVVIEFGKLLLGLIVDNVREVKYIKESDVKNPPSAKLSYTNQYIKNIGKVDDEVILLLDLDKLLAQEE